MDVENIINYGKDWPIAFKLKSLALMSGLQNIEFKNHKFMKFTAVRPNLKLVSPSQAAYSVSLYKEYYSWLEAN